MNDADLVWDDWNLQHIARHGVSQDEVEEIVHGEPLVDQTYASRLLLTGNSARGRALTAILRHLGENRYYVVTARPASARERRRLRAQDGGQA